MLPAAEQLCTQESHGVLLQVLLEAVLEEREEDSEQLHSRDLKTSHYILISIYHDKMKQYGRELYILTFYKPIPEMILKRPPLVPSQAHNLLQLW